MNVIWEAMKEHHGRAARRADVLVGDGEDACFYVPEHDLRGIIGASPSPASSDDSSMFRRFPLGPIGSRVLVTLKIDEVIRC
jgi:hypothetical protein